MSCKILDLRSASELGLALELGSWHSVCCGQVRMETANSTTMKCWAGMLRARNRLPRRRADLLTRVRLHGVNDSRRPETKTPMAAGDKDVYGGPSWASTVCYGNTTAIVGCVKVAKGCSTVNTEANLTE